MQQLRVPHYNIDATYKDLREFLAGCESPDLEAIHVMCKELYRKSKLHFDVMEEYESQLVGIPKKHNHTRAEIYLEYIDAIRYKVDYRVLQTLYERMVSSCSAYRELI